MCGVVCMSVSVVPRTGAWRWRWGAVGACPPRRPWLGGTELALGVLVVVTCGGLVARASLELGDDANGRCGRVR